MAKQPRPGTTVLNTRAVGKLLKSRPVRKAVVDAAERIATEADAAVAGGQHDVVGFYGRDRVRAHVSTTNQAAIDAETRDRTLTRAAGRARRRS